MISYYLSGPVLLRVCVVVCFLASNGNVVLCMYVYMYVCVCVCGVYCLIK